MFLAITDSEVVGFVQGVPGESEDDPAEAVLGSIYVHPEHWGEGIGARLIHQLFDAFRERGWTSVCLAVLTDNEVGRSFYDTHGFETHERRTVELAAQQVEDIVLVRNLCSVGSLDGGRIGGICHSYSPTTELEFNPQPTSL